MLFNDPKNCGEVGIRKILQNAIDHVYKTIERSASREDGAADEIAFIDVEINNMRAQLYDVCAQMFGEGKILESDHFINPTFLALRRSFIELFKIGNCGEHVCIALTYLLEHHKNELKGVTISAIESGVSVNNLQHTYLRIQDKEGRFDLMFDPTCKEIANRCEKLGNLFFRGGRGMKNRYEGFSQIDQFHVEKVVTTFQLSDINYDPHLYKFLKGPSG